MAFQVAGAPRRRDRGGPRGGGRRDPVHPVDDVVASSIEEVAAGAPGGMLWFQLYTQADPGVTRSLVERAEAAGYRAIILTVDLPVLGYRDRDRRTGFLLPHMGNFADVARDPRSRRVDDPSLLHAPGWNPALVWGDLATIRSWTSLPLVLKGILTAEDARLAVEHGVDAIVVSNHGARQLDRVPAAVDVLAEVVGARRRPGGGVGRRRHPARPRHRHRPALGAQGVLIGRPIFWALAAGGAAGVERAIAILREEFELALALLGTPTPADIGPAHLAG